MSRSVREVIPISHIPTRQFPTRVICRHTRRNRPLLQMPNERAQLLSRLIGKRWVANARGPDEFDCWHLACQVEREIFGRELPSIDVPTDPGWAWVLQTISAHPERGRWRERPQPHGVIVAGDGALVLMARVQRAAHIGVWLLPEQGVIHCDQTSGVIFEDAGTLRATGWRELRFYEPKSAKAI